MCSACRRGRSTSFTFRPALAGQIKNKNRGLCALGCRMLGFINDFGHCFQTKSVDTVDLAKRYLSGLLTQVPRKNMERIDDADGRSPS